MLKDKYTLFGYKKETIGIKEPYLTRRILYIFGFTLRYHVFHTSDNDDYLHDHPWWFITFPIDKYYEDIGTEKGHWCQSRVVRPFRFHFRKAKFSHRVFIPQGQKQIRTIIFTGRVSNNWGFWKDGKHHYWKDWFGYD